MAVVAAGRNRSVGYTYDEHFTRRGKGEAWLEVEGSRGAFGGLHLSILGKMLFAGDTLQKGRTCKVTTCPAV